MNSVETKTTDKTYAVKNTHKQEWETPQGLFDDLNKEYEIGRASCRERV